MSTDTKPADFRLITCTNSSYSAPFNTVDFKIAEEKIKPQRQILAFNFIC